jgi:two-component sensor histidine kinase
MAASTVEAPYSIYYLAGGRTTYRVHSIARIHVELVLDPHNERVDDDSLSLGMYISLFTYYNIFRSRDLLGRSRGI